MILVTKTYQPPLEEYVSYLKDVWESGWVTNYGPLVVELERKLTEYLGVKHLFFVNNGTLALQVAIKALELKGEIITTPFSYVATTSSIVWQGCKPIFVDIDGQSLCLDPKQIEKKITPETSGILATHVYGNPCNIEAIHNIAKKHRLKVIYDAAHAFGVQYKGQNVLNFGDISTISFHATKLFHTVEGGAIITNDDELAHKISYMINFGHNGTEQYFGLGINGKNSEMHAAMGLCLLPKVNDLISRRREISALYDRLLLELNLQKPVFETDVIGNYAYYPVIFSSERKLLAVQQALKESDIIVRRYFYPALTALDYTGNQYAAIANDISARVLCLPLYYELTDEEVITIAEIIIKSTDHVLS